MRQLPFIGRKILLLTAHPDDESYVCAGTLHENFLAGGRNMLVCATYGEKGKSHVKRSVTAVAMKRRRKKELVRVGELLRIKPLTIIGLPDGGIGKRRAALYLRSKRLVKKYLPDAVISFGTDGISGHTDHITVGQVARRIARELRVPFYAMALPPTVVRGAARFLKTRRSSGHYVERISFQRPRYKVRINSAIKKRALRLHASQMDDANAFTGFPAFAVKELLRAEYFV